MSVAIMMSAGSTGIDDPPGMQAFSLRPPRMPPAIANRLQNEIAAVLKDPEVIAKLKVAKFEPYFVPGEAFRKYIVDDLNKWKAV